MSEWGQYTLNVGCDHADHRYEADNPASATFTATTRMHAIEKAREKGWMIQHGHRALCPTCAAELRKKRSA